MDDLTSRPWWRWTTGLVVRVEGWGGRPVPCGVVVGSGEMARVADEWGTTPRIAELQAKGARVVPDLDSPATVGVLLERLREVVQASAPREPAVLYSSDLSTAAEAVVGDPHAWDAAFYPGDVGSPCASACSALIAALDGVTP